MYHYNFTTYYTYSITDDVHAKIYNDLNALHKVTGPAYGANVARNFLMCGSAFVATPYFFAKLPEDSKTSTNLFWFGLMGNWTANLAGK